MRCFRFLPLLGLLAALLTPATASAAQIGLNINGGASADDLATLGDTKSSWARHFVVWDGRSEPDGHQDAMIDNLERQGTKTLLVVVGSSKPSTAAAYASFVGGLAQRYKGKVEAYEIWNEADEGSFWPGGPEPAQYVTLLQASYLAIKQADPAAKVVFTPTTGNNYGFLEEAYRLGAKGYFDVMSVHTDTACSVVGPTSFYRDGDRIARFTFLGYREVRGTMLAHGDDKPIWMTEFGWSASQRMCDRGAWAGQKRAGVSEAEQAQFLREAYHCMKEDPYLQVAMWFNHRDEKGDGSELDSYGLRRVDGSRRPAYAAFKDVVAGVDTVSGPCGDFGAPGVQILSPASNTVIVPGQPLPLKVTTTDKDVLRIMLEVKGGAKIRSFTKAGQPLASGSALSLTWQGAKKLPFGKHTIVATAIDAQGNKGTAEMTFVKANPSTMKAQATKFPQLRLLGKGRKRTLTGQVQAKVPFMIGGKVKVEWQNKRNGKWKKIHGAASNANKPFKFKQSLKYKGQWRVRGKYVGKRPFKSSASKWLRFKV